MSHHHSHGEGHDHHDHSHDGHDHSSDIEPALQSLLYNQIEFDKVITFNESESDTGREVLQKTWAQRLEPAPMLVSDADEQLLMVVPFAGTVKLHSLLIRTSSSSTSPKTLKLFLNRDDLDFGAATSTTPTQTLTISQSSEIQDLPVRRPLFGNTYSLTLFFEDNYGEDASEVFYLGFKGEFTRLSREPVEVLYEKAANPKDHAPIVGIGELGGQGLGR